MQHGRFPVILHVSSVGVCNNDYSYYILITPKTENPGTELTHITHGARETYPNITAHILISDKSTAD